MTNVNSETYTMVTTTFKTNASFANYHEAYWAMNASVSDTSCNCSVSTKGIVSCGTVNGPMNIFSSARAVVVVSK